jgi:hypothetical protein
MGVGYEGEDENNLKYDCVISCFSCVRKSEMVVGKACFLYERSEMVVGKDCFYLWIWEREKGLRTI